MKIILTIIGLVYFSCSINNQKNQISEDCTLVEVTKIKASCGIFSVWVGMKFKKKNDGDSFVGLVHCPEFYSDEGYGEEFFTAGKTYEIVATKSYKLNPDEVVLNEYKNTGLLVYKIEKLKRKDKPTVNPGNKKIQVLPIQE